MEFANQLAKYNQVSGGIENLQGEIVAPYDKYYELRKKATDKELVSLTDYPNGVVRCYVFDELAKRKYNALFPILIKHLRDTCTVETQFGDVGDYTSVGDYFINTASRKDTSAHFTLNKNELKIIDSLLIFDPQIQIKAKSELLIMLSPEEKYYARVRQMFLEEKNHSAIVLLSKYKRAADKELIMSLLKSSDSKENYYGVWAVRYFPDHSFYPVIKSIHSVEIKKPNGFDDRLIRVLYQAIVQYKDIPSKQLLEESYHKTNSDPLEIHKAYIWHWPLKKYPANIYNSTAQQKSNYLILEKI